MLKHVCFLCYSVGSFLLELFSCLVAVFCALNSIKTDSWEIPGSPVVRTSHFHCRGSGSIPGWGAKIPSRQKGKKKKKTNSVKQVLAGNIKTKSLIQYWTQGDNTSVVQFVTQSCPALCDPMDYSTPGFPVHHQFLELTQTHVHRIRDAIQPSHLFSSPSPPTLSLAHHQGLFQWVSSSHQVAKILAFQL